MTAPSQTAVAAWAEPVAGMIAGAGLRGGFLVVLPEYRPSLVHALAAAVGLQVLDFRAERMAPLGWEAGRLPLAALEEAISETLARSPAGVLVHNAEALLATKGEAERRDWLTRFMTADWPGAVALSLAVFTSELPGPEARIHRLDPALLPSESMLVRLAAR